MGIYPCEWIPCIYQFEDHHIIIPISVIEELDRFKKGKDVLNCNAREFVRTLDLLCGDKLFNGGVKIGSGNGKISIMLEKEAHEKIASNFSLEKSDHRILNTAVHIASENPSQQVVLVTKDVNLRMKAKSIGLMAEDYLSDHVADIADLYKGRRVLKDIDHNIIDQLYENRFELDPEQLHLNSDLYANEYLILKNGSTSALCVFKPHINKVQKIMKQVCYGIQPKNSEQAFAIDALLNRDIPLVTIIGKSGTGKTLLALAAALENRRFYRQIYLARPVVPLSNKDIGYLPGDIHSKLDPYMQPFYDNLQTIQNQSPAKTSKNHQIKALLEEEKIIVTPLSYIRGRSIVKVIFIIDEAQNLTPHEVKTIVTRAGEGTKIIFTGDINQIDHPYLDSQSNGLSYLIEKLKGQPLYAHIHLAKGERSEISELASKLL